jgi:hypothetical protein
MGERVGMFGHGNVVTSLNQRVRQRCVPYVEGTWQNRIKFRWPPNSKRGTNSNGVSNFAQSLTLQTPYLEPPPNARRLSVGLLYQMGHKYRDRRPWPSEAWSETDPTEDLKKFDAPTLILHD